MSKAGATLTRKSKAGAPVFAPLEIPKPIEYMLTTGMLFELNRVFFHPLGFSLEARPGPAGKGSMTWALLDYTANPVIHFSPEVFETGQRKWQRWYREVGAIAHNLRQRKIGLAKAQSRPDYREQVRVRN